MGCALVGALGVWLLIGKRFSLMYGIPAIPLMWGRILLNTTPEEGRASDRSGRRDRSNHQLARAEDVHSFPSQTKPDPLHQPLPKQAMEPSPFFRGDSVATTGLSTGKIRAKT